MDKLMIQLSIEELNKILAGLGNRPFNEVHELIYNLQTQAQGQLSKDGKIKSISNTNLKKNHSA